MKELNKEEIKQIIISCCAKTKNLDTVIDEVAFAIHSALPSLRPLDYEKVISVISEVCLHNIKNEFVHKGLYPELVPTRNLAKELCNTFGTPSLEDVLAALPKEQDHVSSDMNPDDHDYKAMGWNAYKAAAEDAIRRVWK